jgi:hypothetical protein
MNTYDWLSEVRILKELECTKIVQFSAGFGGFLPSKIIEEMSGRKEKAAAGPPRSK